MTRAVREMREVGIRSFAMPRGMARRRQGVAAGGGVASASGAAALGATPGVGVGVALGVALGVADGVSLGVGVGVASSSSSSGVAVGVAVGVGVALALAAEERRALAVDEDGVAEDRQLGRGDHDGGDREARAGR